LDLIPDLRLADDHSPRHEYPFGFLAAYAHRRGNRHHAGENRASQTLNSNAPKTMPRNLYSPRLSDDVVRALYREGQRRRMPMTVLADELLSKALADVPILVALPNVTENVIPYRSTRNPKVD
jgi:hypothetical protein